MIVWVCHGRSTSCASVDRRCVSSEWSPDKAVDTLQIEERMESTGNNAVMRLDDDDYVVEGFGLSVEDGYIMGGEWDNIAAPLFYSIPSPPSLYISFHRLYICSSTIGDCVGCLPQTTFVGYLRQQSMRMVSSNW